MTGKSLKLGLLISGMVLSPCLVFFGAEAQQLPAPSEAPPRLAEEQFKNIQTLKGITCIEDSWFIR